MGRGARETTANVFNVIGGMPPPEELYLEDTLGDAGDSVKAKVTGKAAHPEGNTGVREEDRGEEELRRVSAPPPTPTTPPVLLSPHWVETAVTK